MKCFFDLNLYLVNLQRSRPDRKGIYRKVIACLSPRQVTASKLQYFFLLTLKILIRFFQCSFLF